MRKSVSYINKVWRDDWLRTRVGRWHRRWKKIMYNAAVRKLNRTDWEY